MTAITNPEHRPFPKDDKRYRIFLAGETLLPPADTSTPRVRVWLREVNEQGLDVPGNRIVEVTESAGSIPRLVTGSYWRNGRRSRPKSLVAPEPVVLEINAPHKWQVVRAGDIGPPSNGGQPDPWIDPADLDLSFTTSNGRLVDGRQAWVVPARTTSGEEVLMLSFEIFRALLGNTSELSLALLGNRWDKVENRFVLSHKRIVDTTGTSWRLDLAPGVPYTVVPFLGLMSNASDARHAANHVYPELVRQGPMSQPAWISAFPPVAGRTFRIRALTVPLPSRSAVLVTQILSFDPNLSVTHINFGVPKLKIPSGELAGGAGRKEPRMIIRPDGSNIRVTKPGDRRPGTRLIRLPSTSVAWEGLPPPKRSARGTTTVTTPGTVKVENEIPGAEVSVGAPGARGSPRPGGFTPDEEREIEDRFDALNELTENLISRKFISGATPYPLVRPTPAEDPKYCEFPKMLDEKRWKWSIVRNPIRRARLALVLEVKLGTRTIYWIETEALNKNDKHHSLAVETVKGDPLEEGMLTALLEMCARNKGVWPNEIEVGKGTVLCERARHIPMGAELSPNAMLLPFARLARKKHQPPSDASDRASTEQAAHPE